MKIKLTLYEMRVLGSLIEKEITTPDQYPISLNGLTNACNQKSNREPVLELDEETVQQTFDDLRKRYLVSEKSGFGSRVPKLAHRFCNSGFGALEFTQQELGIICVLLLRGPQTPGELRTRTNRLCTFVDVREVESIMKQLIERADGPFVVKLPREAGKRESRFAHLFGEEVKIPEASEQLNAAIDHSSQHQERICSLERRMDELQEEIVQIKRKLEQLAP